MKFVIIFLIFPMSGFCTLTDIEVKDSYMVTTQATGASITFSVTSIQSSNVAIINWIFNNEVVSQIQSIDGSPPAVVNQATSYFGRINVSAISTAAKTVLTQLVLGTLSNADSGLRVEVSEGISRTPTFVLNVTDCPEQNGNAAPLSSCQYNHSNCESTFTCIKGFTGEPINATCLSNATWSEEIDCVPETTTVTVAPTTSTTKSDPETTTESPPTELPTTEPLITEGSPTNCTEEEICCECIVGIVIIIISAPPSGVFVVFIVFILYRGDFDFLKRDFKLCTGEFIGTSLAIVCAAILLSRCKSSEHWTGGDIACVVLGWIGAPVDVIFCIILIRKWFQKDYSRGTSS